MGEPEKHIEKYQKYYSGGVLDFIEHREFIESIPHFAKQSGVPEYFLYNSAKELLSEEELTYLDNWKTLADKVVYGGVYRGNNAHHVERMYGICGVMLRNFVDARFLSLQTLIAELKDGLEINNTVVCIPNFALPKAAGGKIAEWDIPYILGWLLDRAGGDCQTLVFIQGKKIVEDLYGATLAAHIDEHFIDLD